MIEHCFLRFARATADGEGRARLDGAPAAQDMGVRPGHGAPHLRRVGPARLYRRARQSLASASAQAVCVLGWLGRIDRCMVAVLPCAAALSACSACSPTGLSLPPFLAQAADGKPNLTSLINKRIRMPRTARFALSLPQASRGGDSGCCGVALPGVHAARILAPPPCSESKPLRSQSSWRVRPIRTAPPQTHNAAHRQPPPLIDSPSPQTPRPAVRRRCSSSPSSRSPCSGSTGAPTRPSSRHCARPCTPGACERGAVHAREGWCVRERRASAPVERIDHPRRWREEVRAAIPWGPD